MSKPAPALPLTLFAACLFSVPEAIGAGSGDIETVRVPKTDNPAMVLELRPGWRSEADKANSATPASHEGNSSLVLAMLPESEVQGRSPSAIAEGYFEAAHKHPYAETKPIAIDGKMGMIFISRGNGAPGPRSDTHLALVKVDRAHFAMLVLVVSSPPTLSEEAELGGLIQRIRFAGEDAALAVAKGRAAHTAKDYDMALACYNEAIRLDSNYAEAFLRRGITSVMQHNNTRATVDFSQAISLNPEMPEVYVLRGSIYAEKKAHAAAISEYTEAIRLNPSFSRAYYARAKAYAAQHDNSRAIADFSEAIRFRPAFVEPYSGRATIYLNQGDQAHAFADFWHALQLRPDNPGLLNALAWLSATTPDEKFRDGPKAVKMATKACELSQWKELTYVDTLAAAYAECGQFAEAVKWETTYLAGNPAREMAEEGRLRLKLYQEQKPYRDSPKSRTSSALAELTNNP